MADALVLDGVSKVYEVGGIELIALHDVDLTVAEEEVVTLLGPSGSGKTTLLSIAGGLLSATTGKVIVGGKNITRARARKLTTFRRKRIGFIFQAVNLVPFLTARENLLVVAELARRDRAAAAQRADRLLDELGLGRRTNNLPAQLSGGERQRVAIGRALMNQPALVLVDEPTSALDSDLGQQVMELIVSEVKARGAAAVIVTHDQRMARYGDRILTMADGRIAGMAPRPEFALNRGPAPPAELEAAPQLRHPRNLRALAAGTAQWPAAADPAASGQWPAAGAPAASGQWPAVGDAYAPSGGAEYDETAGQWRPGTSGGHGGDSTHDPAAWLDPIASPSGLSSAPAAGRSGLGRPGTGQVPAAGQGFGDDGAGRSGFGPGTGQVPAAGQGFGDDGAGRSGFGPGTGQVPAAGAGGRWVPPALRGNGPAEGEADLRGGRPGVGPRTGGVPAAGGDTGGVPVGLWANGPAVTPSTSGPRSGQWPAADDGRDGGAGGADGWPFADDAGSASGQWPAAGGGRGAGAVDEGFPATGRRADGLRSGQWPPAGAGAGGADGWPSVDDAGPVSGQWPAAGGGGGADWMAAERKEVPAGLWANGPAVTPGAGPRTGQVPANGPAMTPGSGPRTGQVPATGRRPDPYDGLPGPRDEDVPAVPPVSAQTPVVPAPDRVWRRPATPAPARPSGTRRPPQLRPQKHSAPPAAPSTPMPMPAAWPEPQPEVPQQPEPSWGTPEFFAEPPPGPAQASPQPEPAPVSWGPPEPYADPSPPPAPETGGVDAVESDRVRWLQQLTPPPTKGQPRPLALPDRPIWPTRYWDDDAEEADGPGPGPGTGEAGDPYDFGEYDDDEEP